MGQLASFEPGTLRGPNGGIARNANSLVQQATMSDNPTMAKSESVVLRAGAEETWASLLTEDIKGVSVRDWGERLIEAHRRLKDKDDATAQAGWRPHREFVTHVNAFYPQLAVAIYLHLDKMKKRARSKHQEEPSARSFERLVDFSVDMIETLGGQSSLDNPGSSGEPVAKALEYHGHTQTLSKVDLPPKELDRRGSLPYEMPTNLKRKEPDEPNEDNLGLWPAKKLARGTWTPTDSSMAGTPTSPGLFVTGRTPGASPRRNHYASYPDHIIAGPSNSNWSANSQHHILLDGDTDGPFAAHSEDRCYVCCRTDHATDDCSSLQLYREHGDSMSQLTSAAKMRSKMWLAKKAPAAVEGKAVGQAAICGICEERGHTTEECALLRIYQTNRDASSPMMPSAAKARCSAWVKGKGRATATTANDNSPVDHNVGRSFAVSEFKGTHPASHIFERPSSFKTINSSPACRKYEHSPAVTEVSAEEGKCGICGSNIHITPKCGILGLYQMYGEATGIDDVTKDRCRLWVQNQGHTPAANVKRPAAGSEIASRQDIASVGKTKKTPSMRARRSSMGASALRWEDSQKHFGKTEVRNSLPVPRKQGNGLDKPLKSEYQFSSSLQSQNFPARGVGLVCHICNQSGHVALDCHVLRGYQMYGEDAMISGAAKASCRKWLRTKCPRNYCSICESTKHCDINCSSLRRYIKYRENTWNMRDDVKQRCIEWLEAETKRVGDTG